MRHSLVATCAYLLAAVCVNAAQPGLSPPDAARPDAPLTLEKIMADPDWMGPSVTDAYWSADGGSVYYSVKRTGSPLKDLHRIRLADGKDAVVEPAARADADMPAVYDRAGARAAFIRNGDVFVRSVASGKLEQITRTPQKKESPQFSADGKLLSFRSDNDWFVHDFASGITAPAAILKTEKDPDAAPAADDMRDFQLRTFATLKRLHDEAEDGKKESELLRKADATRLAAPFYLGEDVVVRSAVLSPDARWLLVVTAAKDVAKGREGQLTRYVTESGYEEFEKERVRVGRNPPAPQSMLLLDLADHSMHPLSTDPLPGINDDPLKAIREENARAHPAVKVQAEGAAKPRGVVVISDEYDAQSGTVAWSPDSKALAIEIFSIDNKDRWIVSVDLPKAVLVTQHRISDPAWVNSFDFKDIGWIDNHTLWYQSEQSGYGHLYAKRLDGEPLALTQGRFEVSSPVLSPDGKWFYLLSNETAPYSYDVYRVAGGGGPLQRLTHLEGVERFSLQQSGKRILVTHSSAYVRPQIAVVDVGSGKVRELTDTRSAGYESMAWIEPEIVQVPSTHFDGVIYAKLYRTAQHDGVKRPGVLFVHGAGYTQDVSRRYSYYFREQMFHNLLAQHGYAVLDLDYRASQGYGRDWRTAIYRQMGHPELEDMLDGKRWLVEHADVDAQRVGVYGGSYGGFMTLMALFRAPGEFAAGAALRPVTDWMQYDHGYTAAILNDPQIDPIAYERSSPLEFAANLRDPLLICHGVIDDNVLFEDSMRLYQRLVELHKDDFSISPYPLDRHGFTNADSWLDEYKRIYKLFEAHLQ
jgi:dipeptidyl aminopeptidase/acylaminoacyl peptidase